MTPLLLFLGDDILVSSASHPPALFGERKVLPWRPEITFSAWVWTSPIPPKV